VAQLMDSKEQVVVQEGAEEVGDYQELQPAGISEECSSPQLKRNNHSNLQIKLALPSENSTNKTQ
jgi:hypothetical protein